MRQHPQETTALICISSYEADGTFSGMYPIRSRNGQVVSDTRDVARALGSSLPPDDQRTLAHIVDSAISDIVSTGPLRNWKVSKRPVEEDDETITEKWDISTSVYFGRNFTVVLELKFSKRLMTTQRTATAV